jgi:hypothetical protein
MERRMSTEPDTLGEPLVWVDGQPTTREQAGARRQELMADPEYGKAAAGGDMVKVAELTRLWRIEHGLPADPVPPANPEDVRKQMLDADLAIDDARLATWEKHIQMDYVARAQHHRGLATQEQHDQAVRMIERMKADRAFGAKVLAGDIDAKEKWMRWGLVASMRVAPPDYDWTKPWDGTRA